MRIDMGAMLLFGGPDHFLSAEFRYAPTIPDLLANDALALVWFTGATGIAGGLARMAPQTLYDRLVIPRLRHLAGWLLAPQYGLMAVNRL
ncbi:MAG: hypothetical protein FJX54_24325 [Alphaproteobacteria bacterium]|nr:hypothetical protein [Alphaproteobacteria bacterium]